MCCSSWSSFLGWLPGPTLSWGGTTEPLCVATSDRHCLTPGGVGTSFTKTKMPRWPESWATCSPVSWGFRNPALLARQADSTASHRSCWPWEDPLALGLHPIWPQVHTHVGPSAVPGDRNLNCPSSARGTKATGTPARPLISWSTWPGVAFPGSSLGFLPLESRSLPRAGALQPCVSNSPSTSVFRQHRELHFTTTVWISQKAPRTGPANTASCPLLNNSVNKKERTFHLECAVFIGENEFYNKTHPCV